MQEHNKKSTTKYTSIDSISTSKDMLDKIQIQDTINSLRLRIEDRFPNSGLSGVAQRLYLLAEETQKTIEWIERPYYLYRILAAVFIVLALLGLVYGFSIVEVRHQATFNIADLLQGIDAVLNEIIIIGAALVFVFTMETRLKRARAITSINRLRALAHVIDAHQLTKDPSVSDEQNTVNSPKREKIDNYQLARYLDYCTELLSLTSKLGFLYVQRFQDPVSLAAVNELENLTTAMARKIWQKITIVRTLDKKI